MTNVNCKYSDDVVSHVKLAKNATILISHLVNNSCYIQQVVEQTFHLDISEIGLSSNFQSSIQSLQISRAVKNFQ